MKKTLTIILAFVLVIALSVAGTMAYLTDKDSVTNTFTVGTLTDSFELVEHEVERKDDGTYDYVYSDWQNDVKKETDHNDYRILPGVDLPKDPFVRMTNGNTETYLFLEVIDTLPKSSTESTSGSSTVGVEWELHDCWLPLMDGGNQVKSKAGNPIYVYGHIKDGAAAATPDRIIPNFNIDQGNGSIIKQDKVFVPDNFNAAVARGANLNFNAYLFQAEGFETALESWKACGAELDVAASAP